MSWADAAIDLLSLGKDAEIRPVGGSMRGLIDSGALVLLTPCAASECLVGDIVLCRVGSKVYLHFSKGCGRQWRPDWKQSWKDKRLRFCDLRACR